MIIGAAIGAALYALSQIIVGHRARRRPPAPDSMCIECTREGRLTPADHEVWVVPDDDDELGIGGGGTAVGADFCAEHCPGGCGRRRCARRAHRGTMAA